MSHNPPADTSLPDDPYNDPLEVCHHTETHTETVPLKTDRGVTFQELVICTECGETWFASAEHTPEARVSVRT
jgi:hypothetical protein